MRTRPSSSLASRGFPGACGTMAARALHSELAGCGAPWRRRRRRGAASDARPPRRRGIATPPASWPVSPGRGPPWGEAVASQEPETVPTALGTRDPAQPTAPGPTCLRCARGEPGAPARHCGRSEPSPSCASRGSPSPPRTSASCRPRLGQRPAPPHATTPGPLHRSGHRPPRGARRRAQDLAQTARQLASGSFGNLER